MRRQDPQYFRLIRSTRIKQGKSQTPTITPNINEESLNKLEEKGSLGMKIEEGTSLKETSNATITYVRKPVTMSTSSKKNKTPMTLQQKGKGLI